MGKIPTLKLTEAEYENIVRSSLMNLGGESIICYGQTPETLYKFFNYDRRMCPEFAYANKRKKLDLIYLENNELR